MCSHKAVFYVLFCFHIYFHTKTPELKTLQCVCHVTSWMMLTKLNFRNKQSLYDLLAQYIPVSGTNV